VTELREQAVTEIGKLPAAEQDAIASRILAELADEHEWETRFSATTDQQWDQVSELARQEISAGSTDPLDDVFPRGERNPFRSRVTKQFRKLLEQLPPAIQEQADRAYARWRTDPYHPTVEGLAERTCAARDQCGGSD
jgi:hypothetical protein